jgi:regulator of RNase E activity RraA
VVVCPGDVVVADGFGVVVVPSSSAAEVLERLQAHQAKNEEYLAGVKQGVFSNQWVDELLTEGGCIVDQ